MTRKAKVPWDNARAQVLKLSELDTVIPDRDLLISAIDLHFHSQISFWDALIIKSASAARCRSLLTEDLDSGQEIDGVIVRNHFLRESWPITDL